MSPPAHHKEIVKFLASRTGGNVRVTAFLDNNNANPIPVGEFGTGQKRLFSTIGAFELHLRLPDGNFEFAACGDLKWLPNALASSIYWMDERSFDDWPLVCEDVVKHNAKSSFRHMAYVPSTFSLSVSTGQSIKWLLGIPISDKEIGLSSDEILSRTQSAYPEWLFGVGV